MSFCPSAHLTCWSFQGSRGERADQLKEGPGNWAESLPLSGGHQEVGLWQWVLTVNGLGQKLVTKENRRRRESPIPLIGWWCFCSTKIPWKMGKQEWELGLGGGGHSFLSQCYRPPGQAKGTSFLCPHLWNRANNPNASCFYTFRSKFISRHIGVTLWWSSGSTRPLSCGGLCLRKDRVGVWETWPQPQPKVRKQLNRRQERNSRAHHGDVSHDDVECLLADGFFTTERPGKPHTAIFKMYNQQESTV